jgi:DNA-binding NarL/FixJ family response regulator
MPSGEMIGAPLRKEVKLLVIDDHADHFEQIKAHAEMYSTQFLMECKLVDGSEDAKATVETWKPTVVLVDTHAIDEALDLIECLAQMGPAVVAMSEVRIPELAKTCQTYGAVGYFAKSNNPDEVESLISYVASVAATEVVSH